jgi:hypothetical protein
VLLQPGIAELERRISERVALGTHFMPVSLLQSQLEALDVTERLLPGRLPVVPDGQRASPEEQPSTLDRRTAPAEGRAVPTPTGRQTTSSAGRAAAPGGPALSPNRQEPVAAAARVAGARAQEPAELIAIQPPGDVKIFVARGPWCGPEQIADALLAMRR